MIPDRRQKIAEAIAVIRASEPMTDWERTAYNTQRAAEMARAEARRAPTPQLALGEAA